MHKLSSRQMLKVSRAMKARRADFLNKLMIEAGLRQAPPTRSMAAPILGLGVATAAGGSMYGDAVLSKEIEDFLDKNTTTRVVNKTTSDVTGMTGGYGPFEPRTVRRQESVE